VLQRLLPRVISHIAQLLNSLLGRVYPRSFHDQDYQLLKEGHHPHQVIPEQSASALTSLLDSFSVSETGRSDIIHPYFDSIFMITHLLAIVMGAHGRRTLRDLFDDSPTPHIAHPPQTHHRHFYVATDGSYRRNGGGLGAVIETRDGTRVARISIPDVAPDNNVAEYRALHLGLDVLAARAPADIRVGVLVDHDDLAATVNGEVLAGGDPEWRPVDPHCVPPGSEHHWRGIRARIAGFGSLRAARIDGRENPAHPLANAPHEYDHVNHRKERCIIPDRPYTSDSIGAQQTSPSPSQSLPEQQQQRYTQTESAVSTRLFTDGRSHDTNSDDDDDDIPPPSRFEGCGYASD
jgi:hypothetical protein